MKFIRVTDETHKALTIRKAMFTDKSYSQTILHLLSR